MFEYCTTMERKLLAVVCIDMLADLRFEIEGMSRILRTVAYEALSPEEEQMLVCSCVL